jgi:hypothetical protein
MYVVRIMRITSVQCVGESAVFLLLTKLVPIVTSML